MNFTFLCLVITQYCLVYRVYATYSQNIFCMLEENKPPVCHTETRILRRDVSGNKLPAHDPYIPRKNTINYDCSAAQCKDINLLSITQVSSPKLILKSCFEERPDDFKCETLRYNYLKNIDKLLFLSNNIRNKTFYLVDCLVYSDGGRVCHKKDDDESHVNLVDTGTIVRPKETNILSQDEFICEQGQDNEINCDLDPFTPFNDGLKLKTKIAVSKDVILKVDKYVAVLKKNCYETWCGYSGRIALSRRMDRYEPPGGWVFRCYYANNQQICKPLYDGKLVNAGEGNEFVTDD